MIAMGDLLTNAKMRLVLALDMAKGEYSNQYKSETYPRLEIAKDGRHDGKMVVHTTTYFVDGIECADLDAVVAMLNTEPHPQRTDLDRHQKEQDDA